MANQIRKKSTQKKIKSSPFNSYWKRENIYFIVLGIILLISGFFVMSIGKFDSFPSLTLSPIILLVAYIIIFPLAILYRKENKKSKSD